jgi:hypothetical protein
MIALKPCKSSCSERENGSSGKSVWEGLRFVDILNYIIHIEGTREDALIIINQSEEISAGTISYF